MKFINQDSSFTATNGCGKRRKSEKESSPCGELEKDSATNGCEQGLFKSRRLSDMTEEAPEKGRRTSRTARGNRAEAYEEDFSSDEDRRMARRTKSSDDEEGKVTGREKPSEKSAFTAALPILSSGANSGRMLREKLMRKGYSREEALAAQDEATRAGLLNDRRLLEAYAESLARRKHYGKSRIRMELFRRFDREVVDAFFEEAVAEIDFAAYAKELARKSRPKSREALICKLRRCGYGTAEIKAALSLFDEKSGEDGG